MCTQIVQEITDFCIVDILSSIHTDHNIGRNIYYSWNFTQMYEKCVENDKTL